MCPDRSDLSRIQSLRLYTLHRSKGAMRYQNAGEILNFTATDGPF